MRIVKNVSFVKTIAELSASAIELYKMTTDLLFNFSEQLWPKSRLNSSSGSREWSCGGICSTFYKSVMISRLELQDS